MSKQKKDYTWLGVIVVALVACAVIAVWHHFDDSGGDQNTETTEKQVQATDFLPVSV